MPACSLTQKRLTLGLREHLSKDRNIGKVTTGEMLSPHRQERCQIAPVDHEHPHKLFPRSFLFQGTLTTPRNSCAAREKVKQMGLGLAEFFK